MTVFVCHRYFGLFFLCLEKDVMKKTLIFLLALLLLPALAACGESQTEDTSAVTEQHIHNVIIDEARPATCNEAGLTEGSHCSVCNEVLSDQKIVPPTGEHSPAEPVNENVTDPTCTKKGSCDEVVYCSLCNKELSRSAKTLECAPHNYDGLICIECNAEKQTEGLIYITSSDGTCSVFMPKTCEDTEIIIPKTSPTGSTVVAVASNAFYGCKNIVSVIIPDTVTSIGDNAFYACENIVSVTMPDKLKSIGSQAFYGCKNMVDIAIPDTVKTIGDHAFAYCTALETVVLPDGLTAWESYVFPDCRQLKLNEYNGMHYLGSTSNPYFLLMGVEDTTKTSYEIHPDAVYINNHAFHNCKELVEIVIPDKTKGLGMWAFLGCEALKKVELPDSLKVIDSVAFNHCKSLQNIVIPNGVIEIRGYAFDACTSLEGIVFENTAGWRLFNGSSDKTGTAFDVSSPVENAARIKKGFGGSIVRK